MRITKLDRKRDIILNGNYFVNSQPYLRAECRLPYRLQAVCRSAAASDIEALIRTQLQDQFAQDYLLQRKPHAHQPLVELCVSLACTTAERAALVRLVNRLGLEPAIRSVRWQSVPQQHAG